MRNVLFTSGLSMLLLCCSSTARTIVVGEFDGQPIDNVFWSDGVCFAPVENVHAGDKIEFHYSGFHNVYKFTASGDDDGEAAFFDCDTSDAALVGDYANSPYTYLVTEEDVTGFESLFFACGVGGHCDGGQKLRVNVAKESADVFRADDAATESRFALGVDQARCEAAQRGEVDLFAEGQEDPLVSSVCSEPASHVDETNGVKYWSSSCVSPAFTMTPGGIINQKSVVRFPFPKDRRVVLGTRIWEFVQEANDELIPVHLNQLYVHHILGDVVRGNGAESVRRGDEDAAFAPPYGKLSGNFDNVMTFHIIDLREVDDWLSCVECRCDGGAGDTGGVRCCSNCTSLVTPTVDYRMRYNVTWSEVEDFMADQPFDENGEPAKFRPIVSLNTDVARALRKYIEFDVPHYTQLPEKLRHPNDPMLMQIVREGSIATIFSHNFPPTDAYQGDDTVHILRCLAHMHVGGVEMRLEDALTGETICESHATYGTDPATNEGFIISLAVTDFPLDEPKVLDAQQPLRLVAIYNATEPHMGVMGLFILDVIEGTSLKVAPEGREGESFIEAAGLTVNSCRSPTCEISRLPDLAACEDDIAGTMLCARLNVCSCDVLLAAPRFPGCGESIDLSRLGNGVVAVDSMCGRSCGCDESMKMDRWREELRIARNALCSYDTADCRDFLSNLRGCSFADAPGAEGLDPAVRDLLTDQGEDMAAKMGELGHEFMHVDKEKIATADMTLCVSDDEEDKRDSHDEAKKSSADEDEQKFSVDDEDESSGRSFSFNSVHLLVLLVLGVLNCA